MQQSNHNLGSMEINLHNKFNLSHFQLGAYITTNKATECLICAKQTGIQSVKATNNPTANSMT